MTKFVTLYFKGFFALALSLCLLSGCGSGSDSTKAKASFIPDAQALDDLEKGLNRNVGIHLAYVFEENGFEVKSVSVDAEARTAFPVRAPHHFVRSTRLTSLEHFLSESRRFMKKHEDFFKNKPLYRRYEKIVKLMEKEIGDEKKLFPGNPPTYTEEQRRRVSQLDTDMILLDNLLKVVHNVNFTVKPIKDSEDFEFIVNPANEFKGNKTALEQALSRLKSNCEEYKDLVEDATVGDNLISNVLEAKIAKLDAVIRAL